MATRILTKMMGILQEHRRDFGTLTKVYKGPKQLQIIGILICLDSKLSKRAWEIVCSQEYNLGMRRAL